MEILENGKPTGKDTVNAKGTLYRKYNPETDIKPPAFKDFETGELYSSIYARIIIKRKGAAHRARKIRRALCELNLKRFGRKTMVKSLLLKNIR